MSLAGSALAEGFSPPHAETKSAMISGAGVFLMVFPWGPNKTKLLVWRVRALDLGGLSKWRALRLQGIASQPLGARSIGHFVSEDLRLTDGISGFQRASREGRRKCE